MDHYAHQPVMDAPRSSLLQALTPESPRALAWAFVAALSVLGTVAAIGALLPTPHHVAVMEVDLGLEATVGETLASAETELPRESTPPETEENSEPEPQPEEPPVPAIAPITDFTVPTPEPPPPAVTPTPTPVAPTKLAVKSASKPGKISANKGPATSSTGPRATGGAGDFLAMPPPQYDSTALQKRYQGRGVFVITYAGGRITNVSVQQSTGADYLDSHSCHWLKTQWKVKPNLSGQATQAITWKLPK